MNNAIVATHNGITITYDEKENAWIFTLRGRERKVESLAKAKEAIDKPEAKKKDSTFQRVKCWRNTFSEGWKQVEATSIAADNAYRGEPQVWVVRDGSRAKVSPDELYPVGIDNNAAIAKWQDLATAIWKARERQDDIKAGMKHLELPKSDESECDE